MGNESSGEFGPTFTQLGRVKVKGEANAKKKYWPAFAHLQPVILQVAYTVVCCLLR